MFFIDIEEERCTVSDLVYSLADSWCFPIHAPAHLHNLRIILRFVLCCISLATTFMLHIDLKSCFARILLKFHGFPRV